MSRLRALLASSVALLFAIGGCQEISESPVQPDEGGISTSHQTPGAIVVSQTGNNPTGWRFTVEGSDVDEPVGSLVSGPGTPPLGSGSAEFVLNSGADALALQTFNPRFVGARLDEISRMEYCTYVSDAPGNQAVALQLNFDDDVTDSDDSWKGRIVFEPVNNQDQGTVANNTWQCWDAINESNNERNAKWWATGAPASAECPNAAPFCSLDDLLDEFPDAGINSNFGGVVLKAGSGWDSFEGNVDKLVIFVKGGQTTYDFEPSTPRRSP